MDIEYTTTLVLQTTSYSDADDLFDSVSDSITTAVTSGNLSSNIAAASAASSGLSGASVDSSSYSPPSSYSSNTVAAGADDGDDGGGASSAGLNIGIIAGASAGGLVVGMLLVGFARYRKKDSTAAARKGRYSVQAHENIQRAQSDLLTHFETPASSSAVYDTIGFGASPGSQVRVFTLLRCSDRDVLMRVKLKRSSSFPSRTRRCRF